MAKKKTKKNQTFDHGTEEARRHGTFVEDKTDVAGQTRVRNVTADIFMTYWRRKSISDRQYRAGDLFQQDFWRAGIGPKYSSMRMDAERVDESSGDSELVHIAKSRIHASLDHVGKPLSRLLIHVLGHGEAVGTWEGVKDVTRPDRDGMAALKLALSALADHYKMV